MKAVQASGDYKPDRKRCERLPTGTPPIKEKSTELERESSLTWKGLAAFARSLISPERRPLDLDYDSGRRSP